MNLLPNFLIIGAAKAGTTSLWRALGQHPDIYMSLMKEPRFFAFENENPHFSGPPRNDYTTLPIVTTLADYQALFARAGLAKARGEASTIYTYFPGDKPAERIRHYLPDVRLIVLLRQPAERTFSNFVHAVFSGWEPLDDFARALIDEPRRIRENWSYFLRYRQNSDYLAQLQRYYTRFDRRQIRVYLYEDLCMDPLALVQDVFRFLEVDDSFVPDLSRRHNVSRFPRHSFLHRMVNRLQVGSARRRLPRPINRVVVGGINRLNLYRPTLSTDMRQQLTANFRPDMLRLQDLINRDLSSWLEI
jgi:hypothetical protein